MWLILHETETGSHNVDSPRIRAISQGDSGNQTIEQVKVSAKPASVPCGDENDDPDEVDKKRQQRLEAVEFLQFFLDG